jgi:hypothetical protein
LQESLTLAPELENSLGHNLLFNNPTKQIDTISTEFWSKAQLQKIALFASEQPANT